MPELWRSVECFLVLLRAFECLWLLCNALKWFWLLCRTLELCPVQCRQSALVWSIMGAPTLTSAAPLLLACMWTSFFFVVSGHHQHHHSTPQGKVWRIGGARSAKIFQQHTCATTFLFQHHIDLSGRLPLGAVMIVFKVALLLRSRAQHMHMIDSWGQSWGNGPQW